MYQPKILGELSVPKLQVTEVCELMGGAQQAPIKSQLWRLQDLHDGGFV